jgi:hypothetical protein
MRVAVLGSWSEPPDEGFALRGDKLQFQQAARRVGHELIRRGHSLVVGSDGDHTADRHAVEGAVEALQSAGAVEPSRPRVLLIRRRKARRAPAFAGLRVTGAFVEQAMNVGSEGAVKQLQVAFADAVLLLCGAAHTEQAGIAAALSGKPLACIGSFGGAAHRLNETFAEAPTRWGLRESDTMAVLALQEPFGDGLLVKALRLARIEDAPRLMLVHGRSLHRDDLKRELEQQGIRVVVLTDEFEPTMPIPEKFERYAASVDGAIVLVTPDDVGGLADGSDRATRRARENVWVEAGWFWGRRGRGKLMLLRQRKAIDEDAAGMPSDLGNVEHYFYAEDPWKERRAQIEAFIDRLRSASDQA